MAPLSAGQTPVCQIVEEQCLQSEGITWIWFWLVYYIHWLGFIKQNKFFQEGRSWPCNNLCLMFGLPSNLACSLPSSPYSSKCKLERTTHYLFFYFYNLAFTSSSYRIWLRSGCQPGTVTDALGRASAQEEMNEFPPLTVRQGKGQGHAQPVLAHSYPPDHAFLADDRSVLFLICHICISFKGTSEERH